MKDSRTRPFLLMLFGYIAIGGVVLTANTVLKTLLKEFSWTDAQGGLLISCMSMGNLTMSILGNLLMEKIGRQKAMMLYSGFIAVSYLLFALSPQAWMFYPLMVVAGFAWGGINSLANTIVSEMYDGSTSRLNVLHANYAASAVLFPLLVGFMVQGGLSWRVPAGVVAAVGALLFVFSALTPLPARKIAVTETGERVQVQFWKEMRFYLGVLTFFTYVGVETAACAWLSVYLSQVNAFFRQVPSETMVSLMWLTMIVGRLLFAAVGAKADRCVLLLVQSVGFLLGMLGIIFLGSSTVPAILAVAFMGLSMSAMYATGVANSARYIACSAVAPGIIFGAGGLGAAVVPYVAGLVSDAGAGLRGGMLSLCAFLGALILIAVVNIATRPDRKAA